MRVHNPDGSTYRPEDINIPWIDGDWLNDDLELPFDDEDLDFDPFDMEADDADT